MTIQRSFVIVALGISGSFASGCTVKQSFEALTDGSSSREGVPQPVGEANGGKVPYPGKTGVPEGIYNGHFDLDTSLQVYAPSKGTTSHHSHEYDKVHATTSIDFFDLLESGFDNIQESVPAGSTRFFLLVANAEL